MANGTIELLFALIRSAVGGEPINSNEKALYSSEILPKLIKVSQKHDVAHLVVLGLKQNGLLSPEDIDKERFIIKAVYRLEKIKRETENLKTVLKDLKIPFILLKGAVLRGFYPDEWMRTSCDIDVLIHNSDLENVLSYFINELNFTLNERTTHDVSLTSSAGVHVEFHYDLLVEGNANNAHIVLQNVWDNVKKEENNEYSYKMSDEFFYFYHIAHMAKHFGNGGCGIRPFIDLWLLDRANAENQNNRNELLKKAGLLKFTLAVRNLSEFWFSKREADDVTLEMQRFILLGGVYGTTDNRVAINQKKKGGKFGYLISRIFASYDTLRRYYPILEKHKWLMPIMQVRRWFMIFRPDVAEMAKKEIQVNSTLDNTRSEDMKSFLDNIGLQ